MSIKQNIKNLPVFRQLFRLDIRLNQLVEDTRAFEARSTQQHETFVEDYRRDLVGLNKRHDALSGEVMRRLNELESETATLRNRLNKLSSRSGLADAVEWDQFYVDFENAFRGSKEDIRKKQEFYLPYLEPFKELSQTKPILDIGCGRGEFLELLRERGFGVKGIELNSKMAEATRSLGIECINEDAIVYLKDFPDESFAAITAFHVVEHIPFENLMYLLREARRTLVVHGKGIFETPNPENMVVGACNFYNDLSHVNPIPPTALHFCADWAGFRNCDVVRLAPMKPPPTHEDADVAEVLRRFACEQDYAVIGEKL